MQAGSEGTSPCGPCTAEEAGVMMQPFHSTAASPYETPAQHMRQVSSFSSMVWRAYNKASVGKESF